MQQTVKLGRVRAASDPDRSDTRDGVFYGSNVPRHAMHSSRLGQRTTRGVWVKRVSR